MKLNRKDIAPLTALYVDEITTEKLPRAEDLYGGFSNLLPNFLRIPKSVSPDWAVDQFSWADPVGTMDHIEEFLNFRNDRMTKLIEKATTE